MYTLIDTFNDREISTHRTIAAAARAEVKHLARVRRANGAGSYLTYRVDHANGNRLDASEYDTYSCAKIAAQS